MLVKVGDYFDHDKDVANAVKVLTVNDAGVECAEGDELLKLNEYPGTNAGCNTGGELTVGECKKKDGVAVAAIDSVVLNVFSGKSYCATKLGASDLVVDAAVADESVLCNSCHSQVGTDATAVCGVVGDDLVARGAG